MFHFGKYQSTKQIFKQLCNQSIIRAWNRPTPTLCFCSVNCNKITSTHHVQQSDRAIKRDYTTSAMFHTSSRRHDLDLDNQERQISVETKRVDITFKGGQNHPVTMDVQYVDMEGATQQSVSKKQVILALHGCPGSHKDMAPFLTLADEGNRVIIPNFPGYGYTVGKTDKDQAGLYHSNTERVNFILAFLNALQVHRVDAILAHSAATFPSIFLISEHRELFKSLVMLNPPPPQRRYRIVRPYWLVKALGNAYDMTLTRPLVSLIVKRGFQSMGFATKNVEFMIPATQMAGRLNFPHITEVASKLGNLRVPLLFFYCVNDPFLESHMCKEYVLEVLGIPEGQICIYGDAGELLNQPVSSFKDDGWYKKVFQMSKGGHFPQKNQDYLNIILDETRQILKYIQNM